MNKTKIMTGSLKSGLILGVSGFVLGFIGPIILYPNANQGPLLGIFITGPGGFLLGCVIGLAVGVIRQYNDTRETRSILKLVPKVWNGILWASSSLAVLVIVVGIFYIPWHE